MGTDVGKGEVGGSGGGRRGDGLFDDRVLSRGSFVTDPSPFSDVSIDFSSNEVDGVFLSMGVGGDFLSVGVGGNLGVGEVLRSVGVGGGFLSTGVGGDFSTGVGGAFVSVVVGVVFFSTETGAILLSSVGVFLSLEVGRALTSAFSSFFVADEAVNLVAVGVAEVGVVNLSLAPYLPGRVGLVLFAVLPVPFPVPFPIPPLGFTLLANN